MIDVPALYDLEHGSGGAILTMENKLIPLIEKLIEGETVNVHTHDCALM